MSVTTGEVACRIWFLLIYRAIDQLSNEIFGILVATGQTNLMSISHSCACYLNLLEHCLRELIHLNFDP
jgi:hypothetical protein